MTFSSEDVAQGLSEFPSPWFQNGLNDCSGVLIDLSLLTGWEEENEENDENDEYHENSRGHPQALPYLNHIGDSETNKGNSFSKISFLLP